MNNEEFNTSMRRILAFHNTPRTPDDKLDMQNYLTALYEAVGRMDAFTFERVCKELSNNMSRGQKPMPSQFWAVYHRLKGEENTGQIDICNSCKSTGWAYVHMVNAKEGLEGDFCVPCPECRKRHPLKDSQVKPGWTVQEIAFQSHEAQLLAGVKEMGAKGARFVLDLADKMKVNFSDTVLSELVQKAGDEPAQENKVAELALAEIKREPVSREQTAVSAAVEGNPVPLLREEYEVDNE